MNHVAQFIASNSEWDSAPRFRRDFSLDGKLADVVSATLSTSALGVCEAWINGARISEDLLTPGWTSYEWRLHHVDHEVAPLLASQSTIGILVGNGWYRGRLGWFETRRYGEELAAYVRLTIRYADGHVQVIGTDESWQSGPSEILTNDIYDGQTIDARRLSTDWTIPGFESPRWSSVHAVEYSGQLDLDPGPPVRRVDTLLPVKTWRTDSGTFLIDFGQNIVGFIQLRVRGQRGARITIRHAEVLEDGGLAIRTLRSARATDEFILSGGDDVFEPTFTFHGFRYAEVTSWPGDVHDLAAAATAKVISSDLRRIGYFKCSVPDLNTFHENVIRGMRGNFIDIPTDCPQRDERLGWTGDIAAFSPTAAYLFDVKNFLSDWLMDLALEQAHSDRSVPFTVPNVLKYAVDPRNAVGGKDPAAFWSDAAVWVPWSLWEAYGDQRVLQTAFGSMVAHGRKVRALLSPSGVWDSSFQFGDWLDPDAPAEHPELAKADPGVVATACAYRTATRIRGAAEVLRRPDIAAEFRGEEESLRAAFQREYVQGERIVSDCTTVYALALVFGLLEAHQTGWAGRRLAALVQEAGHHISTGFAGTPFIADALSSTEHVDTAYQLLLQRECPSWLYPVTIGATTIWERWDSMLPDGRINPGEMTSFNHYALGAVADWMHREVGGLAPAEPGYRRIRIAPKIGHGIDWAQTSLETPHGLASVRWDRDHDVVLLRVRIPEGSTGILVWPGHPTTDLEAGDHTIELTVLDPESRDFERAQVPREAVRR